MIFDKIANMTRYSLSEKFVRDAMSRVEFVKGRVDFDSDDYFRLGLEYHTQDEDKALWEAHRKYLDIHIILQGEEEISVTDISNAVSSRPYEDDYELFNAVSEQRIHLKPNYFLMLFPNEVHRTTINVGNPVLVQKFVYKYLLNE